MGPGSGAVVLENGSSIAGNTVTGKNPRGGGLYCEGDYSILMFGGQVHLNTAGLVGGPLARGGGVYLDGCQFVWFSQDPGPDQASLDHNFAYGYGGGLYATGGAQAALIGARFTLFGEPASTRPLRIFANEARTAAGGTAGAGGAIYTQGGGTEVTVDRSWILNNIAQSAGGAAYVAEDSVLNITRTHQICHSPRNCSRVSNNHANSGGGAIFAWNNSQANIRRTKIENNTSGGAGPIQGKGVLGAASDAKVRLEDSLMHGAFGSGHALAANGGSLEVRRSTIADTRPSSTLGVFGLNGAADLVISNSIVHEQGENRPIVRVHGGTPDVYAECVIWHDDSLDGMGLALQTEIADPLFADRQKGLYYLRPGSPAINYCGITPPLPGVDLDWNPRGLCHSTGESCNGDVYDLGAYEFPIGLFSDRFEETP